MRKPVAVLCTALFALTACGQSEDAEAKENIKASVLENDSGLVGDTKLTEEQAACFSDGLVDEVGVEKLQEYKLIGDDLRIIDDADPTDMSAGDAEATADVIVDCVDLKQMIEQQINDQAETDLTEEQSACISDAIDEDAIRDGLAASFQGKDEENPMQESLGAMMACVMGDTAQ